MLFLPSKFCLHTDHTQLYIWPEKQDSNATSLEKNYEWCITHSHFLTNCANRFASFSIAHTQILWSGQSVHWWSIEVSFQEAGFPDTQDNWTDCLSTIFFSFFLSCGIHEKLCFTFTDYFWGDPGCVDKKWHCYWWYSVPGRTLFR